MQNTYCTGKISVKSTFLKTIFVLIFTFSTSLLLGCQSPDNGHAPGLPGQVKVDNNTTPDTSTPGTTTPPDDRTGVEISVMTFNVENMFDNVHNDGVGDWTYLPLSEKTPEVQKECDTMGSYKKECLTKDWSDEAVDFKLSQVAKVISGIDQGKGPDNLFLVEVENLNILNQLVQNHMKNLGYQTISISRGPDPRGINVAFISKFPMVGQPIVHIIPYTSEGGKKSRGILEVTVKINNKNVTFLSAHFPSLSNPTAWRVEAHEYMKDLMLKLQSQGRAVIAGGDFNTSPQEESANGFFSKTLSQAGDVSHLVGCQKCEGTYFYRNNWQFLDAIIYSKNLEKVGGLKLLPSTIEVIKTPGHVDSNGRPFHFNSEKKLGVSDHLPIMSRLKVVN